MSGLNYTSRIFALLGEILVRIRVDKRSPPQGAFLTARLEEVQALHARIVAALAHAPEPLRLKPGHAEFGGPGFRQAAFTEVKDFFDNPNASRANALNPFLVMQANLYVTQVRIPCLCTGSGHVAEGCVSAAIGAVRDRAVPRRADHVASRER